MRERHRRCPVAMRRQWRRRRQFVRGLFESSSVGSWVSRCRRVHFKRQFEFVSAKKQKEKNNLAALLALDGCAGKCEREDQTEFMQGNRVKTCRFQTEGSKCVLSSLFVKENNKQENIITMTRSTLLKQSVVAVLFNTSLYIKVAKSSIAALSNFNLFSVIGTPRGTQTAGRRTHTIASAIRLFP